MNQKGEIMITYKNKKSPGKEWTAVYLDKKHVGNIYRVDICDWQYFPKGKKEGGEMFPSLNLCKKSLEKE